MRKTKQEKLIEYEIVKRASEGDVDATIWFLPIMKAT